MLRPGDRVRHKETGALYELVCFAWPRDFPDDAKPWEIHDEVAVTRCPYTGNTWTQSTASFQFEYEVIASFPRPPWNSRYWPSHAIAWHEV